MPIDIKSYAMGRASAGGGPVEPNLQAKEVTVKTGTKTITPDEGFDGLSSVKVTGAKLDYQEVTPNFANESFVDVTPSSGYDALWTVTINKDNTLIPSNIKKNVTVHGVTGNYEGSGGGANILDNNLYDDPWVPNFTDSSFDTYTTPSGYDGTREVYVDRDENLIDENIKSGVTINGITGNYTGSAPTLQNKTVTPSNQQQTVQADSGYDGLGTVTVNAAQGGNILQENSDTFIPDFSIDPFDDFTTPAGYDGTYKIYVDKDPNHVAENIKSGVTVNGITGSYTGSTPSLQNKTVTPSNVQQTVQADSGYDGLGTVTVNAAPGGGGITPPSKGFCPTEWDNDGFITKGVLNGMSDIPAYFFCAASGGQSAVVHEHFEKISELTLDTVPSVIGKEQQQYGQTGYTFNKCYNLALKFPGQSSASSDCVFPSGVTRIETDSFVGNKKFTSLDFPATLDWLGPRSFQSCSNVTTINFHGTPSTLNIYAFQNCSGVTTINVPWSEGDKTGAPWGATNATVNYDVTT